METAVETNETNEIKDKKVFISKAILFCIFGCILPFVFIAWRFEIFSNGGSHISLTGWGVIGIIIVFLFVLYCLKILKNSIPFSMTYQILSGLIKVILPLLLLYLVVNAIEGSVRQFKQVLFVVIGCESVAIVVNAFPKYMHDKGIEKVENLMDLFFKKKKESEQ